MSYSPLTLSRRHVLGELYARCDRMADGVPVYLNDATGEKLGFVDESLGKYADAFTFHLSEDVCKKLAGGQFIYSFDYHFSESAAAASSPGRRRIKLISIFLTMRKGYEKPVARSARKAETETEGAEAAS
ncbi:MAG TPA: hypothetical protein VEV84_08300 [Pyrinomonadaceae bacterium]|nr:hypothetical protein [Pyrinomonadaceae bacterium]